MKIEVRSSEGRGRGVFAVSDIAAGELIETCPVIPLPAADLPAIDDTALHPYYFGWPGGGAIALGFGSLYNHSATPNAACEKHPAGAVITFRALTPIRAGEEVLFAYDPGPGGTLWFEAVS